MPAQRGCFRVSVTIESLDPEDWRRLRDARLRALRDAPETYSATLDEESSVPPADWRRWLSRPDTVTIVARADSRDVGLAFGEPRRGDRCDAGVAGVWVDPAARGNGTGEALLRWVIEWAGNGGYRRLLLDVGDTNVRAQRLYRRLGFRPTGATSALPPPRHHITEHELALWLGAGP